MMTFDAEVGLGMEKQPNAFHMALRCGFVETRIPD